MTGEGGRDGGGRWRFGMESSFFGFYFYLSSTHMRAHTP